MRSKKTEAQVQRQVMLALSDHGCMVYRNNSGQYKTAEGHVVRYGVGNPGGSDLIGITPIKITPDMVGRTIGVFTAVEVKSSTGRASDNQMRFIKNIKNMGGMAGIARSEEEAIDIISSLGGELDKPLLKK